METWSVNCICFSIFGSACACAPLSLCDDEHVGEEEETEALPVDPSAERELGDRDGTVGGALLPRDAGHLLHAFDEPAGGGDEGHGAPHLFEVELLGQDQQLLHTLHRAGRLVALLHQLQKK